MFDGQTTAASHAFEVAYRSSRDWNDRHGIDGVPSLCRNGQALYLSGDFGAALSNIDAGLTLAYDSRFWTSYIDRLNISYTLVELNDGRIGWVPEIRVPRLANYPDAWPVVIGAQNLLVETEGPSSQLTIRTEPIWLDAIELFYSEAMALRIRNSLLGKIADLNDLSPRLTEMYSQAPANMPEILQRCQNVCHAIALRSMQDDKRAAIVLQQNLTLDNGYDHPLTSIALLELASIAAQSGDLSEAQLRAGQSSLLAARLGQADVLSDALFVVTRTAEYAAPGSGLTISEEVLRWSENRFGLTYLTALATALESASITRNTGVRAGLLSRFERLTKSREVDLPLLQAAIHNNRIRDAVAVGQFDAAKVAITNLNAFALGSDTPTALVPEVLQAQVIKSALRDRRGNVKQWTGRLAALTQRPRPTQMLLEPWQMFVWDSMPLNDLYAILIDESLKDADPDKSLQLINQWHERQLRVSQPLWSRMYEIRDPILGEINAQTPAQADELKRFQARFVSLRTRRQEIDIRWQQFQAMVGDDKVVWQAEQARQWLQLQQLATGLHQELIFTSLLPIVAPANSAEQIDLQQIRSDLRPNQAIVGFFDDRSRTLGYLIDAQGSSVWSVADVGKLRALKSRLLDLMMPFATVSQLWQSQEQSPDWQNASLQFTNALMPPEILIRLQKATQVKIIPHGAFWSVPFEVLIENIQPNNTGCWIANSELSYALSLRAAGFKPSLERDAISKAVYLSRSNFLVPENAVDQELQNEIQSTLDSKVFTKSILGKDSPPNFQFQLVQAEQIDVASEFYLTPGAQAEVISFRDQSIMLDSATLANVASANSLHFYGITAAAALAMQNQSSILTDWLSFHRNIHTEQILIRQWAVNGESTSAFMSEFLRRNEDETPEAFQKSILSLWETNFNTLNEPRFHSSGKRVEGRLISGKMPLFWGGWKLITNYPINTPVR